MDREDPGDLTYLGWEVCGVPKPPIIARSPNCLFCSQGDPADASCTCGGHPGA